jgi:putative transcriptional regulator
MRERRTLPKQSLAGSLLLAHPSQNDPNFRRTVVLMSVHDGDGAMGVVLNRALDKQLGDLNGEFALGPLAAVPLYYGGPVQDKQLILVAWEPQEDGFRMHFGIEPTQAIEFLSTEGIQVRAFLGYSGWSKGQLERELKHDAWVVTPIPDDLLGHSQDTELWRSILGQVGASWRLLADEPEDTSLN